MPLTSTTSLPRTRSGRTFFVALALLGVGAVTQLLVLAGYLLGGGAAARRRAAAPVPFGPPPVVQPAMVPANPVLALAPALPTPAPVAADTPLPMLVRPTPVPAARLANSAADLLEQARQLRGRGDSNSALARLREAQVAEPDNPQIIGEMASTYEAMQLPDRAYEQWQRLYNLGDGAGVLYALADFKIHHVPATPAPAGSPPAEGAAVNPQDGTFQAQGDAVLKLADVHLENVQDPAAERKISLRIVVKNRPGTAIDPTRVRILTYFYDLVDGKDAVLTDAQTAFAWLTPGKIDWANDKSEVLETTYTRLKATPTPAPEPAATPAKKGLRKGKGAAVAAPSATPAATPATVRTYLGYTVRLYYDRQLQDVQADPVRLLQQFPPQMTLPAE